MSSDTVQHLSGLHVLRLNKTRLAEFPRRVCELPAINEVYMSHNQLTNIPSDVSKLKELTNLVCRDNKINERRISCELFNLPLLTILDLSKNEISSLPDELELAKNLLVLNAAFNNIESISNQLFVSLTELTYLDLSNNKLSKTLIAGFKLLGTSCFHFLVSIPAQLRRLTNLRVLKLSNNPLQHAQLRQLPALTKLEVLHLKNTDRNPGNFPTGLETLTKLRGLFFLIVLVSQS